MSVTYQDAQSEDGYSMEIWKRMTDEQKMASTKTDSVEIAEKMYRSFTGSADRFSCVVGFQHLHPLSNK